ncbi:MAG: tryptophan synthase subunit alpha [Polyangiaceae bacterium]
MTERLKKKFDDAAASKTPLLIAYVCVGDPSVESSVKIALACVGAGADILELGVPFSDPTADGPSIARASQRAIAAGGGLEATLRAAKEIRAACDTPIVLFGYYNPILVRGEAKTVDDAAESGVDALLVVDLPLDEGPELRARALARGIPVVPLVTPASAPSRLDKIRALDRAKIGFVYYVSVTGVTGAAHADLGRAGTEAARVRKAVNAPVVVGFGVDSPEKALAASTGADGVVIGTAIVRRVEIADSLEECITSISEFIGSIRNALASRA